MRWQTVLIGLGLLAAASAAEAQSRVERVQFAPGASGTLIQGTIRGDEAVDYLLGASAGQRMIVSLQTTNASNYFNVTAPGAAAAMFIGSTSGSSFSGMIPSSGDYRISVYLMRNAARRNEAASYSLSVQILGSGQAAAPRPPPDYADGNAGGPDYWQVTGLAPGDRLNVRGGPSTQYGVVAQLDNGQVVRNLGCTQSGATRWCKVEPPGGGSGWVAGRYLREAGYAAPAPARPVYVPPPVRAGPPRTVKCSITPQQCLAAASQTCGGGYQVVDSDSHAGGLLTDTAPGPVTWYSMTFVCGPSNGRPPSFRQRGPTFVAPVVITPKSSGAKGVRFNDMMRYCQGEASARFNQRPQDILTLPVETTSASGYRVYGQYPRSGRKVKTFVCKFDSGGVFKTVERN